MTTQQPRILKLVLTRKWYEMIESGVKTEEYRELKQFYFKRFCSVRLGTPRKDYDGMAYDCYAADSAQLCPICIDVDYRGVKSWWEIQQSGGDGTPIYDEVEFSLGYSSTRMKYKINSIDIGYGNPEWGAPIDKEVFIIKLGEKLK